MGSELGLLVRPLEEPLGELLGESTKAPREAAGARRVLSAGLGVHEPRPGLDSCRWGSMQRAICRSSEEQCEPRGDSGLPRSATQCSEHQWGPVTTERRWRCASRGVGAGCIW